MLESLRIAFSEYWDYLILIAPKIIIGLIILSLFVILGRLSKIIVSRISKKFHMRTIGKNFLAKAISWIFYIIGLIVFMHIVGWGGIINSLLAGAGISAIIIGFAFKDIAENFLSGLLLAVQSPFKVGNIIEIDGYKGTVKGIDLRNTHLRNAQGKDYFIPNSIIVKNTLTNYTKDGFLRLDFVLGLDTNADIVRAREIVLHYLSSQAEILKTPEPQLVVENMGVSTLDVRIHFWTNILEIKESPGVLGESLRGRIIREIRDLLIDQNFSFPSHILEHKMYDTNPITVELKNK